ncbi:ABC transporter substrate-binding protein [Falsiroseomonas oryzae]|uniref:ABC transporter substrate-binding protein n=1 Tax=Falsiroseomonas oryzae TaxID=2766473 RepID=UPI0022EB51E8|nr:ABC transporter substrate-binding protein [Roseomonas sp. MO-31]
MTKLSRRDLMAAGAATLAVPGPVLAQGTPRRGGTLILAIEGEPATLTSHLATDTPAMMVANNLFNALVLLNEKLEPVPDLATSWTVSPDGRAYAFELAQNVRWHDGRPLTAADVEFTFNEIVAKLHPRAGSWWPNVESAKATGPHSFEFRLKQPFAPFLTMLGSVLSSGALIMPKHVYENTDARTNPANQRPIGSGPFTFSRWQRGSFIELNRNATYFKPNRPYLDRLVFQVSSDPAARLLAFERGEIDFLHWYIVPYDRIGRLRTDRRFRLYQKGDAAATNGLMLINHRHDRLKDAKVRQALAHAINRETINQRGLFGEAKVAKSHVGSTIAWAFTDRFDYAFDPAKANALLDEAGFRRGADGRRFPLRLFWASGRDYEGRGAEIIRDNLRDVGVDVTVQVFDRTSFTDRVFRQWDFDLAMQLFTTGPDPTVSVTPRYHTNAIRRAPFVNGMGYSNPEVDALFDREPTITDPAQRAQAWHDIQRILMRDLPALPLFELPPIHAASARFADVVTGPQGYIENRENAYELR